MPDPVTVVAQSGSAAASEPSPRRDLPIDVQVKVDQIQRKADLLLGYADGSRQVVLPGPPHRAADHLRVPARTVAAYLAVPGAWCFCCEFTFQRTLSYNKERRDAHVKRAFLYDRGSVTAFKGI